MGKAKSAPESGGARVFRAATGAVLIGGTALVIAYDWLGIGGPSLDSAVNGPIFDAVVLSAGLACLLKAVRDGRERGAWLTIGAAILCWAAGEIYWTAYLADDPSPPYPSPADAGHLAFYPLAIAGLYLLVHARAHELDWRLWMDGLIATLGTAALGAAAIFEFVADRADGSNAQVATTLAYPLFDIVVLSLIVGIVALTRWRPGRTWSLLLLGIGALVTADIAYTLQSTDGAAPGTWIEPFYLLAAVCVGVEAWQPEAARIRPAARFDGWRELMVPAFFAAMMIGLFVFQRYSDTNELTTALWTATLIAVLTRLAISVRRNKRLLEQVRTDLLTGLGNRGRMQVDLAAGCERAQDHPAMLVLFDLNGFKRYNDTFGHPAGDAMLVWLGGQLRAAVGGDGTAYRIGGDEFAVLIDHERGGHDAVAKRAAEALTAKGKHFEVGSSWGAVSIPAEADTPAAAIRLADVRMYAQKESRRIAREGAVIDVEGIDVTVRLGRPRDGQALEQGQ